MRTKWLGSCCALLMLLAVLPVPAQAHFLWVVKQNSGKDSQLHLYFSEEAAADDPALLDRVLKAEVWQLNATGKPQALQLQKGDESLWTKLGADADAAQFLLTHDLGVMERGGQTFRLRYYGKTGPELGHASWQKLDASQQLALNVVPELKGDQVVLMVQWQGKPLANAQVKVAGPGMEDLEANTNAQGQVTFPIAGKGLYSIRARHMEEAAGKLDDKAYQSVRHYSTLALQIPQGSEVAVEAKVSAKTKAKSKYPVLPETVTSFGAAVADNALYVYGGHTGAAHSYDHESQARTLRRLDLKHPAAWESLGEGPGLQGLAMVAHRGKLYRIGGFTAKNKVGDESDLWSQNGVASYDPATKKWTEMAPLPEPRSSFDAAVLGDKLYVIGGWQLQGAGNSTWHKTAYVMDLSIDAPLWTALPAPPFERRALSVAVHQGKVYAIGGMQHEGGPCTKVDIFDPATGKWSQGPSLQGEGMEGFGNSSFAVGDQLFVSTMKGNLQRLSADGSAWETVRKLDTARFFHRMLPVNQQLLFVGGASMGVGKFDEVEVIDVK